MKIARRLLTVTASTPHGFREGVRYLLVNGEPVLDEGRWRGKLSGRIIKLKKS